MGTEYEGMRFEWDREKARANIANHHGVTFFSAREAEPKEIRIYEEGE